MRQRNHASLPVWLVVWGHDDLIGFLGRGGKTADHQQSLHDPELGVAIAGFLQQHGHHLFYMMHCHIVASHQKCDHMNPNLLHHQLLPWQE